jgi:hypothetical protein
MYTVVEVDAVADAVLQTVTSRNHDSVLFVVLPSIWLKDAHMLILPLLPASRSVVNFLKMQGHGKRMNAEMLTIQLSLVLPSTLHTHMNAEMLTIQLSPVLPSTLYTSTLQQSSWITTSLSPGAVG